MSYSRGVTSALAGLVVSWLAAAPAASAVLPVFGTASIFFHGYPEVTFSGTGSGASVGGGVASHPVLFGSRSLIPVAPTLIGIDSIALAPGALLPAGVGAGANGFSASLLFFGAGQSFGTVSLSPVGGGFDPSHDFARFGPLQGDWNGASWQAAAGTATPARFEWEQGVIALAVPITITATAFDNRTVSGAGVVQFVAPAFVQTGIFGAYQAYGTLTLSYTPEPGTIVLLGSGIAGLAALGRRKQRR